MFILTLIFGENVLGDQSIAFISVKFSFKRSTLCYSTDCFSDFPTMVKVHSFKFKIACLYFKNLLLKFLLWWSVVCRLKICNNMTPSPFGKIKFVPL
jgi:hypothetical protein